MSVQGRTDPEVAPRSPMHRSTRLRRLIVAFLVVVALAVAVRFTRAAEMEPVAVRGVPAPEAPAVAVAEIDASAAVSTTMGLLR